MGKIKLFIFLAVLFYLFYDLDWSVFFSTLSKIDPKGLLLTLFVVFLGDVLLALRLYFLCYGKCPYNKLMEASMLALVANTFLPAKLGELSKFFYLLKRVPFSKSYLFFIIFLERVMDVMMLFLFLAIANKELLVEFFQKWGGVLFFLLLGIGGALWIKRSTFKSFKRRFKLYLSSNLVWGILLCSFLLWGVYVLTNIIFFYTALHIHLDMWLLFQVSMVAFFVAALPLTPGGIGSFQAAFVAMLPLAKEEVVAATILLQFLYFFPSLLYLGVLWIRRR